MRQLPRLIPWLIALLVLSACRDERTSPAWIESLRVVDSLSGTGAALRAFEPELNAVMPGATLRTAESSAGAVSDVRSGTAVAALVARTDDRVPDGLAAIDIGRAPLSAFVPFTFPLEGLTSAELREIAGGRVTNWREVGGPAVRVEARTSEPEIAGLLFEPRLADAEAVDPETRAERPGWVVFSLGATAGPTVKPLRIDGVRPDEPDYPLQVRWTIVGRNGDERAMMLGRALAGRVEERGDSTVVLDAVGDIMLGRAVGRAIEVHGPAYPFAAAEPLLDGSDLRIGNLELPLTERGTPARKDYTFRAPPSVTEGLTAGGLDLVTLANNHMLDYGVQGLLDTLTALQQAGIAHPGAGRNLDEAQQPAIVTVNGLRIAFLSYVNTPNDGHSGWVAASMTAGTDAPGVAWGTVEAVRRGVAAARNQADLVVVAIHAGAEYSAAPNVVQRELGYAAVDAGAALVLGAHPHVLQGIEFYKGAPIVYSLGNFIFDVDDDDRRQPGMPSLLSAVLRVRLDRNGVRGLEVRPALIDERDGRPLPATGATARSVYERIYSLTDSLNAGR